MGWDLVPFLNKAQVHLVEVGWRPHSPRLGARLGGVLPGTGHLELGSLGTVSQREGVWACLSRPCACWGLHSRRALPAGSPFYWAVLEQPHVRKDRVTSWGSGGLESRVVSTGDAGGTELSKVPAAGPRAPGPVGKLRVSSSCWKRISAPSFRGLSQLPGPSADSPARRATGLKDTLNARGVQG